MRDMNYPFERNLVDMSSYQLVYVSHYIPDSTRGAAYAGSIYLLCCFGLDLSGRGAIAFAFPRQGLD